MSLEESAKVEEIKSIVKDVFFCNADDIIIEKLTGIEISSSSALYRIITTIKQNNNEIVKKYIIKTASSCEDDDLKIINREIAYFDLVVPILRNKFEENIPIVKHYYAANKLIIMEDLNSEGYITIDSDKFDLHHIEFTIIKLAQLHATTLNYDWNNLLKEHFKNDPTIYVKNDIYKLIISTGCEILVFVMENYIKLGKQSVAFYKNWLEQECFNTFIKLCNSDEKQINILCHGDCWASNIFYKIEENNIKDLKFVDFQEYKYVPPSRDILNLLYTCTDQKFRDKYELKLLEIYTNAFNSTLIDDHTYKLNVKQLIDDYNHSRLYGLIMKLLFETIFVIRKNNNCFNKSIIKQEIINLFNSNEDYMKKIKELTSEFTALIDHYYLSLH